MQIKENPSLLKPNNENMMRDVSREKFVRHGGGAWLEHWKFHSPGTQALDIISDNMFVFQNFVTIDLSKQSQKLIMPLILFTRANLHHCWYSY
jgi:hypothetical protein